MLRIHSFGKNPYESIYGLESEYISFFAIEYEYNYPWTPKEPDICFMCSMQNAPLVGALGTK